MTSIDKVAIHRRYNDEVINQGDLDLIDAIFTPDYVDHVSGGPDIPGPAGLKQFLGMFRQAFPDAQFTVEDRIVDGDRIAVRWTMQGTHQSEFQGIPPTGKAVTVTGIAIHRFAGDQIQESWDCYDALSLLQQLGVIPTPGQAGTSSGQQA
jgi:steroid delta-isomerase-like uncharacterized protein